MSRSPSGRRFGAIRLLAVLSAVLTLAALTIPLLSSTASAETASPAVTVTAIVGANTYAVGATIPNLTDGQDIHIHVDAQSPPNATASSIFAIEGRECANNPINNSFDFTPTQGGNCANVALGAGSLHPNVGIAAPNTTGDMDFNAGVGATTFTDGDLNSHTVACFSTTTCKLVVALGVPGGTQYVSFPLAFASTAPGEVTASSVPGDAAGTVNWTPPATTGGSPIDHYLVTETSPVAGSPVTVAAPTTSLAVTGLTNFTAYTYKVQAVNGSGLTSPGTAASASTSFTPHPGTAPVITGAIAGPGSVALSWSAASGGPTGYTVSSNPSVVAPAACVATTALTCNFTGLTNGQAYTFIVTANYTGGTVPSAASAPVTPTSNFGSVTQTVTVTRPADVFAIGEACSGPPYPANPPAADKPWLTNTNALENCALPLGNAVYQPGGFYQATGTVKDVEVRDTRTGDLGWHVDATVTDFTSGANTVLACNFGYAPAASGEGALAPYTQTINAATAVAAGCPGGGYVAGSTGHTVATGVTGHGLGDSLINGNVIVDIPASAPAGTYTAVLTFTLFTGN
jgi:Fibronectin type III domain